MVPDQLPTGTVTFLFTDIEGSTALIQRVGDRYPPLLAAHGEIIRRSIADGGGFALKTEGDSFFAVFESAGNAVLSGLQAQTDLVDYPWPEDATIRVRMGLHTGEGTLGGADYVGLDVHRAARVADAAHGGQLVMTEATAVLAERHLPDECHLRDLGKHRLRDLSEPESLFQLESPGLDSNFPPLRTLDAVPNNLPLQVTSFVGREKILVEALRLLDGHRVLTLTGPGGTGKTRLSLQVAAESADAFPDGVFFVGLSPVADVDVVPSAILSAIGLQGSSKDQSPSDHLLERLADRQLLLLLDNFEQLLDAAPLVAGMVRASPKSKFLVTSRAPLKISGEQEMPIPPLGLVDASGAHEFEDLMQTEAVELFAERAVSVRPDFVITHDNIHDVVRLVERLDGLPLAIELVASRLRLLPVSTILQRLDAKMLSGGSVDLPERQRTINGAIDWSYDLLDEPQRRLFARLSVFAGGARLQEIEAICGSEDLGADLIDCLSALVDHSLVRASTGAVGPRFRMLHVIREYAASRLAEGGESEEMHRRHLAVYTELMETLAPEFLRKDRKMWFDAVEEDHDNIRSALEWGMNREVDLVLRLSGASWRFWQARGHLHEARRRVESALAQPNGSAQCRAKAMEGLGGILWWQGDMERCLAVYEETVQMQRDIGDRRELANALYNYASPFAFVDSPENSEPSWAALEEAHALYRELDDDAGQGDIEWGKGNWHILREDFENARAHFDRSADFYKRSGNEFGRGWALFEAGEVATRVGDARGAWPYIREGLELFASQGDISAIVLFLSVVASIAQDLGDADRAERIAGVFHQLRISSGTDLVTIDFNSVPGLEYEELEALEGEAAARYREGKAMTLDDAIEYALAGPTDGG